MNARTRWQHLFFMVVLASVSVQGEQACEQDGKGECSQEEGNTEPPPLRFILVGKRGSGKSATGNSILGEKRFPTNRSYKSVTTTTQIETKRIRRQLVEIVDTPSPYDNRMSDEDRSLHILRMLGATWPGAHVFLFVIEARDLTVIDFLPYYRMKALLGNVHEHMIVVFTHLDLVVKAGESEETFLSRNSNTLKKLLTECGQRYVFLDNMSQNGAQIDRLFQIVIEMNATAYHFNSSAVLKMLTDAVKGLLADIDAEEERFFSKTDIEVKPGWLSFLGYYALVVFLLAVVVLEVLCYMTRR